MARAGDILGYARASTVDQDVSGQVTLLKDAGAIRGFEDVVSGRQFDRAGLSALMDHARPGDSLTITRVDQLGRSLKELLETVKNLKEQDIGLTRLEERIDMTSAAGELIFHVFGAIARFEHRLISERTKGGIEATRAQGRNCLGPAKPRPSGNDCRTSCKTTRHGQINSLQIDQGNKHSASQVALRCHSAPSRNRPQLDSWHDLTSNPPSAPGLNSQSIHTRFWESITRQPDLLHSSLISSPKSASVTTTS